MPYRPEHRQRTHGRIVGEASRLFREQGFYGVGVDEVMSAAGLTRGGFYAHFRDKAALLGEALQAVFTEARQNLLGDDPSLQGMPWLTRATRFYLSRRHLENPGRGCGIPTLQAEVSRASEEVRRTYTDELGKLLDQFSARLGGGKRGRGQAIVAMAIWVGAVSIARAVTEPALADEILQSCRQALLEEPRSD
jgi:TetR/AcrR family transcriptional regulator, transcriptional repressor for nem operon